LALDKEIQSVIYPTKRAPFRWVQLFLGILCMVMVANMQYGWTLFVNPMNEKFGWSKAAIQLAFTIFVLTETWLVPVEGYIVDKLGPKPVIMVGGILVGIAWALNGYADTLFKLYFAQTIGGIGAGAVYGTCVGQALKWFPDRRGLAAGLTAAGFGMGSALTIIPISAIIKSSGYQSAFLYFGVIQGVIVFLCSFGFSTPNKEEVEKQKTNIESKNYLGKNFKPTEVLLSPIFWVMYLMFVLMAAGGLMAVAQLAPIAKDLKIADIPVSLIGITLPALTFALSIDRVLNGITRPFFGWVSDHIGRENTMFIAFAIEGIGILLLNKYGSNPIFFVVLSGLVFFAWGEIYSLFPATCGDTFGSRYAATNAGMLYTAKGPAALLVPFSSLLTQATGSWHAVFVTAAVMNFIASFMAITILKPMRKNLVKN